jgi:cation diffusion facilitator family transporter
MLQRPGRSLLDALPIKNELTLAEMIPADIKERDRIANAEKHSAAASSVLAAVALTGLKIVVGLATGSLGILAEAAHSALDLVAALLTLFAVRWSSKPADNDHPYGHGKIESLSGLVETVLLLATCGWIVYGATTRLLSGKVEIDLNIWAFVVILISIVVDISRTRVLSRAAKKYGSQALEADALHFSTDIWSSAVVLLGLICVKFSEWWPQLAVLRYADAVAALIVALIVIWVCGGLGLRTVKVLLDTAPRGLDERIRSSAEGVPGVANCHNLRMRYSGAQLFIDMHVYTDGNQTLREAHLLTEAIERAVLEVVPGADITVHPEPRPDAVNEDSV